MQVAASSAGRSRVRIRLGEVTVTVHGGDVRPLRRGDVIRFGRIDVRYELLGVRESDRYLCCVRLSDPEMGITYVRPDYHVELLSEFENGVDWS